MMQTQPQPVRRPPAARPPLDLDRDPQTRVHLCLMGWEPGGTVEVVAGTNDINDPNKIKLLVAGSASTRRGFDPAHLNPIEHHAAALLSAWGNVYVSVGTYGKQPTKWGERPSRYAPLPRRGFMIDDVTDRNQLPLPPTWITETSPGNFQIGYVCTRLLSPPAAERMARGAAERTGGDRSGADATQLVRLAGTLNTKAKCDGTPGYPAAGLEPTGWTIRLVATGPRYTYDELARAFLPGALAQPTTRRRQPTATRDRDQWRDLPSGAALMQTRRYQRFFTRRPQLAALARGQRITLDTRYGPRDSGSEQVAVLISNLLTIGRKHATGQCVPGLGAPPLIEVRAVALYWRAKLRPGQAERDYQQDVDRLIARYLPVGYAPEATGGFAAHPAPAPPALGAAQHLPTPRGRPAGQAPALDRLTAYLHPLQGLVVTRETMAHALGCTERSISSYLGHLVATQRLTLTATARGYRIVRVEKNSPVSTGIEGGKPNSVFPIATPQTTVEGGRKNTPPLAAPLADPLPAADPTVPDDPPLAAAAPVEVATAPVVRLIVLTAVAQIRTDYAYVDQVTGALKPGKVTMARLRKRIPACDAATLRAAWDWLRRDERWAAYRAELHALSDHDLTARCKAAARALQRAVHRALRCISYSPSEPRAGRGALLRTRA